MVSWNVRRGLATVVAVTVLLAGARLAQAQSSSTIVGVVRDESGAPLPGVTVEVASPALIERRKVTVTGPTARIGSSTCGRRLLGHLHAGRLPDRAREERSR